MECTKSEINVDHESYFLIFTVPAELEKTKWFPRMNSGYEQFNVRSGEIISQRPACPFQASSTGTFRTIELNFLEVYEYHLEKWKQKTKGVVFHGQALQFPSMCQMNMLGPP